MEVLIIFIIFAWVWRVGFLVTKTRIALMNEGEILQIGDSEEILANPASKFVEKLNNEGYEAKIFMERRGFYRVSYSNFTNRNDAFQEYRKMKNKNIEVWVIRH